MRAIVKTGAFASEDTGLGEDLVIRPLTMLLNARSSEPDDTRGGLKAQRKNPHEPAAPVGANPDDSDQPRAAVRAGPSEVGRAPWTVVQSAPSASAVADAQLVAPRAPGGEVDHPHGRGLASRR
jgi:hypothetical protein